MRLSWVDGQGTEDGYVDDVGVRARAGNDDQLVQSGEGEGAGRARKEWQLRWDQAEQRAVVSVLLTFLADDGADEWDQSAVAVGIEAGLGVLESTQHDVSESAREVDGGLEGVTWELVLARLDRGLAGGGEDAVGAERMEFFLGLHCGKGLQDELLYSRTAGLEASNVVGDVVD